MLNEGQRWTLYGFSDVARVLTFQPSVGPLSGSASRPPSPRSRRGAGSALADVPRTRSRNPPGNGGKFAAPLGLESGNFRLHGRGRARAPRLVRFNHAFDTRSRNLIRLGPKLKR
jgi:hypothetical protein